jgi:hypothetical protein
LRERKGPIADGKVRVSLFTAERRRPSSSRRYAAGPSFSREREKGIRASDADT